MSVILNRVVKANRTIEGVYQQGKRKGEDWEFLTLEVIDGATGYVWNCQLPSEDESYPKLQDNALKGHKVKVRITGQTAQERQLPNGSMRMEIRSQVTRLEDLGPAPDED